MNNAVQDAVPVEVELARSDADLVARFVEVKDQAAFAKLVRRHSGLVMGVCRRVLRDAHDIDDVFQATFLVLVRNAARVRKQASLASWLYGVAYRLAVRAAEQKQRRRETVLVDDTAIGGDALAELADRYDQQLVDAELNALPERYRQPLVLKYLAGKSPRDVATELGITVGAVEGLLKRGKDELRARLMRRGVKLGAAVIAVQMTRQSVQAACPETLIEATVQTGLAWNSANISALDLISDRVLELAGKELATMTALTKTGLTIGLTAGALALGLGGVGFLVSQLPGRASAGIVSTLPVANSSSRGLVTTVLTADPNPGEALVDAGAAPDQPAEVDKGAVPPQRPVPGVTGLGKAGNEGEGTANPANAASLAANAPAMWDFKQRSPAVMRIEQTMAETSEVDFVDVPLTDALGFLKELHNLEVILDKVAFDGEAIATDAPITLSISGVSLRSTLNMLLEPLQLDYVIKNEVLVITTREKAEETMETRVYNVARIPHLTPKELVEIIVGSNGVQSEQVVSGGSAVGDTTGSGTTANVGSPLGAGARPGNSSLIGANWLETGGGGGTAWAGKTTLIIRQTQRVHREIVELLDQLVQEEAAQTKTPADMGGRSGGSKPTPQPPASPFGGAGATGTGFSPAAKGPAGSGGSVPTKTGGR